MDSDLGGTDIYSPLKYIYKNMHLQSNTPRSIFIISDGSVSSPDDVVKLIY